MADQRYYWMNPKRHEFLNHIPFGEYGNDYGITSVLTPLSTGAVLALIGERWSGDPVFCLCNGWPHALSPHRLEKALERYDIDVSSNWLRDCTDITGIFVQARGHLHKEWHPSTRGPWFDWDEVPYSGPFDLVPSRRRYCIKWLRTSGITAGIPVAAPLHHMDERLMHPEDRGTRWRRVMQAD